jgi:hypothetical protein
MMKSIEFFFLSKAPYFSGFCQIYGDKVICTIFVGPFDDVEKVPLCAKGFTGVIFRRNGT